MDLPSASLLSKKKWTITHSISKRTSSYPSRPSWRRIRSGSTKSIQRLKSFSKFLLSFMRCLNAYLITSRNNDKRLTTSNCSHFPALKNRAKSLARTKAHWKQGQSKEVALLTATLFSNLHISTRSRFRLNWCQETSLIRFWISLIRIMSAYRQSKIYQSTSRACPNLFIKIALKMTEIRTYSH